MVEIFYQDLSEEKQVEVLEEFGVGNAEDMNWDVFPITIVECDPSIREEIEEETE